jgi:signal transduction histidine kinase
LKLVEARLQHSPYLILDVPTTQQFYRELIGTRLVETDLDKITELMRETRLLVLPLRSESRLRALFVFLIPELFLLCHGVADGVTEVLDDIAKMLRLADEYEMERTVGNTRLLLSLLGGAANHLRHKIKQPVFRTRAYLEELLHEEFTDKMKDLARKALKDVEAFETATKQFVLFARQFLDDPQPTNLAKVLREAVDESALRSGRCVLGFDVDVPVVIDGYHEPLVTAFHHLWTNANRAVEKFKDGQVTFRLRSQPNECVVQVIDNGVGMDPETVRRAFDPFFSRYESSGLGLPAAQSVIHAHRGKIELVSKPNNGTTVTITLPRSLV